MRSFTVVDTGGIGGGSNDERFEERVRAEADLAMDMADVIVFVTDGKAGVTPVDQMLARELRKTRKPIIVAVNKIDHEQHANAEADFSSLGFPGLVAISAAMAGASVNYSSGSSASCRRNGANPMSRPDRRRADRFAL